MQKMGSPPSPHISLLAESAVEPFPDSVGSVNDITNIFIVQLQLLQSDTSWQQITLFYFVLFCFCLVSSIKHLPANAENGKSIVATHFTTS